MGIFPFNRAKKQGGEKRENGKGTNTETQRGHRGHGEEMKGKRLSQRGAETQRAHRERSRDCATQPLLARGVRHWRPSATVKRHKDTRSLSSVAAERAAGRREAMGGSKKLDWDYG